MPQIEQEVRQFVIDNFLLGTGNGHFCDDDSFLEKGLVDSMGILSLVTFVQGKYAITVEDEELVTDNWDSVHRISRFVRSKLSESKTAEASVSVRT
jgi:acyl carrier protein